MKKYLFFIINNHIYGMIMKMIINKNLKVYV